MPVLKISCTLGRMIIVNAMFGCGLGGIEQAFLDYCNILNKQGNSVVAVIHPKAEITSEAEKIHNVTIEKVSNVGQWDPLAVRNLRGLLEKVHPDIVITHGNRAAVLMKKAAHNICPVVGLAHNYSVKNLIGLDAIFAITDDLKRHLIESGQPENQVFRVPNMIDVASSKAVTPRAFRAPPVIGTMGRFVEKKGIDVFLQALARLHANGVEFRAVIGGEGEEEERLKKLAESLGLQRVVEFIGWVKNKDVFYESIDIFCLPSHHEPFGIVLLEAFSQALPVVTTDSEGPSEIASHKHDALVVQKGDEREMAKAIAYLIRNQNIAAQLAVCGLVKVRDNYDAEVVGKIIQRRIEGVVRERKNFSAA